MIEDSRAEGLGDLFALGTDGSQVAWFECAKMVHQAQNLDFD